MTLPATQFLCDRPCKRGHDSPRFKSSRQCVQCCRINQRGKYRKRDLEQTRRAQRKYMADPEKRQRHYALVRAYKARKRNAEGTHTALDIGTILRLQKGRCAYCRRKLKRYEVDHIYPVIRGGSNGPRNIQLVCRSCNARKSDLDPLVFARRIGLLC